MALDLADLFRATRVVAVLGAHDDPARAAYYVPEYLRAHGYRIVPVNPALAGRTLFGEPVRASLAEIAEPVDLVDVFRRAESLPAHLSEFLAMTPLPKVVWLQLGISHGEVARALEARGVQVVQDRCIMVDHRHYG